MYKPIYIFFLQMEKTKQNTQKNKKLYEHVGSLLNVLFPS